MKHRKQKVKWQIQIYQKNTFSVDYTIQLKGIVYQASHRKTRSNYMLFTQDTLDLKIQIDCI